MTRIRLCALAAALALLAAEPSYAADTRLKFQRFTARRGADQVRGQAGVEPEYRIPKASGEKVASGSFRYG